MIFRCCQNSSISRRTRPGEAALPEIKRFQHVGGEITGMQGDEACVRSQPGCQQEHHALIHQAAHVCGLDVAGDLPQAKRGTQAGEEREDGHNFILTRVMDSITASFEALPTIYQKFH